MALPLQILAAVALDLAIGDPRWFPHPVKLIGRAAAALEAPLRRLLPARAAGVVVALLVCASTAAAAAGLLWLSAWIHPAAGHAVAVLLLYTTFAARDLARHSGAVAAALRAGDLPEARRRVGCIVGRETERLDEAGVARAAVESVAENTVDGVTAPLLFAAAFGPVGALVYKAASTLDSTFGYRNERYAQFGWASARLDDAMNWLPARLTAPLICLAAALMGFRGRDALRIMRRDRRRHASPNAGWPEAAMAGALGVQLGGPAVYAGEEHHKPTLGDPGAPIAATHIRSANRLMLATAALVLIVSLALRAGVLAAWNV